MHIRQSVGLSLAAAALLGLATTVDARALMIAPTQKPGASAANADVVFIGKVSEIETETVEATPYKGSPKDQRITYKIAVVKLEESLSGGKGLTQFRVAFPSDAGGAPGGGPGRPPGLRVRPIRGGGGPVSLTAGQEGVFFLSSHHGGDFYVLANDGSAPVLDKKAEGYKKELDEVKKVIKTIDEPVAALKAKELGDRYNAALLLLQRYQMPKGGVVTAREAIPAEENKLILDLMVDLPWQPDNSKPRLGSDPMPPNRMMLWNSMNPNELGFKQPNFNQKPGDAPIDVNQVMDEASKKFLKDNAEKIKIKRYSK